MGKRGFSAAPRQREPRGPQWLLTWVNVWNSETIPIPPLASCHSSSILDTFVVSRSRDWQSWQATGDALCATVEGKVRSGSNDVDPVTKNSTGLQLLQHQARDPPGYSANAIPGRQGWTQWHRGVAAAVVTAAAAGRAAHVRATVALPAGSSRC